MITLNTVRADIALWLAQKKIDAAKTAPSQKSSVSSPSPVIQRVTTAK